MFIESVMPPNHLVLCRPLLPLPSIFSSIRVFSNKSALHIKWPKYWGFSFNISPSNEYSELISFRMDWCDLLAVQGLPRVFSTTTVWILQHSAFFMVQLSHLYMTTGKTLTLTGQTFVGKGLSLLLNMFPRSATAFLPRPKCRSVSWLQPSSVISESRKIRPATAPTVPPSACHEVIRPDAMVLVFSVLGFSHSVHSPPSPPSKGSLVPLHFQPLPWYHLHLSSYWHFSSNLDSSLWFLQLSISHGALCICKQLYTKNCLLWQKQIKMVKKPIFAVESWVFF